MNGIAKTVGMALLTLASVCVLAAETPKKTTFSAVQSRVGEAAVDPKAMGEIMAQLPADDQKKFLAAVNAAIAELPGSPDDRTAKFVDANRAALMNAQKGNLAPLVTEMFATVEVASLPTIVETFSQELFNRASDENKTYVDSEYIKIAKEVVNQVETRTAEDKAGGARTTFAVLMFIQSSNGSKEVEKELVEGIASAETREIASREWIPAALGETQKKTYDPILGYVGELQIPVAEAPVEVSLAVPETLRQETLLSDLAESLSASQVDAGSDSDDGQEKESTKDGEDKSSSSGGTGTNSSKGSSTSGGSTFQSVDASATSGKSSVSAAGDTTSGGADQPRSTDPTVPYSPTPTPTPTPEPEPYNNQTL